METLRIAAFSDFHGDEIALEKLKHLLTNKYDYVLIAGDIENNISYAEELVEIVGKYKTFFVPGNNDGEEIIRIFDRRGILIHNKRVELAFGLNLVGFGFSNPTPFNTIGELSEEEIYESLSNLKIDSNTILLTHCPPKGILDKTNAGLNIGSTSIRRILEEKSPLVNLFGHVHEVIGKEFFGRTLCINIPPAFSHSFCSLEIKKEKENFGFEVSFPKF